MPYDLFLASTSPRRKVLLAQLGVEFGVIDVNINENHLLNEPPQKYVERLALDKANEGLIQVSRYSKAAVVVGADTIVVVDQDILGKPENQTHAAAMLRKLSGRSHVVLTSVAVVSNGKQSVRVSENVVSMCHITPREAAAYWATGEAVDKAGGYAIQGLASVYISHLSGSYSGVMGLPLFETNALLNRYFIKGF